MNFIQKLAAKLFRINDRSEEIKVLKDQLDRLSQTINVKAEPSLDETGDVSQMAIILLRVSTILKMPPDYELRRLPEWAAQVIKK